MSLTLRNNLGCYTSCAGVKVKKKQKVIHGSQDQKKAGDIANKKIYLGGGGLIERGVECKLGGRGSSEIHV